jgi:hypothetical protein
VGLDDVTAVHLVGADAAVVEALRSREATRREAERASVLEERVLLLDAEQRFLISVLAGHGLELGTGVGGVRRHVGQQDLAHDQHVRVAPQRVGTGEHRAQHAVGVLPGRLVGAGAVEAPDAQLGAVREDLGLRPQTGGRLGAVDPDVLGLVNHARS